MVSLMNSSGDTETQLGFDQRDTGIANTALPKNIKRWSALIGNRKTRSDTTAEKWLRTLVFRHIGKMNRGVLTITDQTGTHHFGEQPVPSCGNDSDENSDHGKTVSDNTGTGKVGDDINAQIFVEDSETYTAIALNGVVGAAEAYMDGHWTTPDLVSVIRFFVSNISQLKEMDGERNLSNKLALSLLERFTRNSISRAKENISAHYDLGNDFFELFLDPTMMYSAALFKQDENMSLEQASIAKLDQLCQMLQLKPEDHLVEIGTGWGGMAIHAVKNYGCSVTTTTLSKRQMQYTKKQVAMHRLEDKITVLLKDYRELTGTYDKLVSIEMIEAVGHQYFSDYFAKCSSLLKPDGLMALQAITISDQRYDQAKKSVDFIQRYIFPGGCLPSLSVIADHTAKDTDMTLIGLEDLTKDYALTLKQWRQSFTENLDRIRSMGFDERFIRMWMYYLCYCEGGFRERVIGVYQILSAKPDYRVAY